MENFYFQYHKTSLGELKIGQFKDELCLCDWRYRKQRREVDFRISLATTFQWVEEPRPIILEAISQLTEYLEERRVKFDLPLKLVGTDFQQNVWKELMKIPFGRTESYSDLAKRLGNLQAVRAVAGANGANAMSIIIPCHRVVGQNGNPTGYAGGIPAKLKLLALEAKRNPIRQLSLFSEAQGLD